MSRLVAVSLLGLVVLAILDGRRALAQPVAPVAPAPTPTALSSPAPPPAPATPTSAPLAFDVALDRILSRSTAILTQEATVRQTAALDLTARTAFLPSVGATLSQDATRTLPGAIGRTQNAAIGGELNLFRFGADFSALRAAQSLEASSEAQLRAEILRAETSGARALVDLVRRRLESRAYAGLVNTRAKSLEIARARYGRGLLASQEVDRISVDLSNSEAEADGARFSQNAAVAEVERLLGHAQVEDAWPWTKLFTTGPSRALAEAEVALEQRPDWQVAKFNLETEQNRVNERMRRMLPSVDAKANYGWYDLQGAGFEQWTGSLTLSIPIFDRLTGFAAWRAERQTRTIYEIALDRVERDARAEIRARQADYALAVTTALNRERTLGISRRLYDDAFRRFQGGRTDANELSIDQDRVFRSELLAIAGWASAHQNLADLCAALGRRLSACR